MESPGASVPEAQAEYLSGALPQRGWLLDKVYQIGSGACQRLDLQVGGRRGLLPRPQPRRADLFRIAQDRGRAEKLRSFRSIGMHIDRASKLDSRCAPRTFSSLEWRCFGA